jgi:hypothetical protein
MKLDRFWTLLDELPRAAAARHDWKTELGHEYDVAGHFLKSSGKRAHAVTCPHLSGDGCPRRIMETETGGIRAVCDSLDNRCDALDLTREDVIVLTLDKAALGSRIGKALTLSTARKADAQASVWHVGDRVTVNGAHVPVYFAVVDAEDIDKTSIFETVVSGMQPSLLLVPTSSTLSPEQAGYLAKSSVTVRPITELIDIVSDGGFSATLLAGRILRELENKASAQISAAPKRAWQLPPGTEWSKVKIRFVSAAEIVVTFGKEGRRFEPDKLGMKDGRNGQPSSIWELLKLFAKGDGFLAHRSLKARPRLEKKKQLLSAQLKEAFGIEGEPITVEPDGYHCQFLVSAADLDQGKEGQVYRNFASARK